MQSPLEPVHLQSDAVINEQRNSVGSRLTDAGRLEDLSIFSERIGDDALTELNAT